MKKLYERRQNRSQQLKSSRSMKKQPLSVPSIAESTQYQRRNKIDGASCDPANVGGHPEPVHQQSTSVRKSKQMSPVEEQQANDDKSSPERLSFATDLASGAALPPDLTRVDVRESIPGAHAVQGTPYFADDLGGIENNQEGTPHFADNMEGIELNHHGHHHNSLNSGGSDYVVEAHKVEENPIVHTTQVIDVEKREQEESSRRRRRFILGFLAALVLIGGIVSIVLWTQDVFAPSPSSTIVVERSPTVSPSTAPSLSVAGMVEYVESLSAQTDLANPSSPQALALEWMLSPSNTVSLAGEAHVRQLYIMAVLYFSTNGAAWSESSGWLDFNDVCEWHGSGRSDVRCNDDGLLEELDLNRNRLAGQLPSELGLFGGQLKVFDVTANALSGTIPSELGLLSSAEIWYVSANLFEGTVPTELGGLTGVENLYIDGNSLSGAIPSEVCELREVAGTLKKLWADCEEVDCPCCGKCCTDDAPCNEL